MRIRNHKGRRIRTLAGAESDRQSERESSFQQRVIALADSLGWRVYHDHDSRGNRGASIGYPDLTMVRRGGGRVIFAELKTEKGKPTREQLEWLNDLRRTPGAEAYLWRPADWEEILRTLAGADSNRP